MEKTRKKNRPYYSDELRRKLVAAIHFIKSNSDKKFRLDDIAREVGISPFYFHRLFTGLMGRSFGKFSTQLKMETALYKLMYDPKIKITNLALELGYESVSSFNKMFKKEVGMNPTVVLENYSKTTLDLIHIIYLLDKKIKKEYGKKMDSNSLLKEKIDIKELPTINLAYVQEKGDYHKSAPLAWKTLRKKIEEFKEYNLLPNRSFFGISLDNPYEKGIKISEMRFNACVEISPNETKQVMQKFEIMKINSGKFAIFTHVGPWDRLGESFHEIFGNWLYKSNKRLRDEPIPVQMTDIWDEEKNHLEKVSKIYLPIVA